MAQPTNCLTVNHDRYIMSCLINRLNHELASSCIIQKTTTLKLISETLLRIVKCPDLFIKVYNKLQLMYICCYKIYVANNACTLEQLIKVYIN